MDREKNIDASLSQDEDYAVKTSRRSNIISYIVCVLAAIVIWLLIMNLNEPTKNPSESDGADADASAVVDLADFVL